MTDCEVKKRIDTWKEASRIAKFMRRSKGEPMIHYRCPVCGRYHIGHKRENR